MTPDGWHKTTYDRVADINPESLGRGTSPDEVIEYLDIGAVGGPGQIGKTQTLRFGEAPSRARRRARACDTLISTVRPYLRSFAYLAEAPENLVASTGFAVLRPKAELEPRFLFQSVLSDHFVAFLVNRQTGSNYPAVGAKDVAAAPILVPPVPEQRKIAAILSSVDEVIEKTEAVIESLQTLKKAMMQELLTRGLPGRHTRFKQNEIGEIPEEWEVAALGDVGTVFNGKAPGTGGTWLRVFKTKHVYDGPVRLDKPEFARDATALKVKSATYCQPGDTLTPNMAHGTIGRVAFLKDVPQPATTVDGQVTVIRAADRENLDPRFLFEVIASSRGKRALLDREKGGIYGERRGQTHLYPTDVKTIPVQVPPIEEQQEIAAAFAALDAPLETNQASIQTLARLKSALMSVLLTGELRVTPDEDAA